MTGSARPPMFVLLAAAVLGCVEGPVKFPAENARVLAVYAVDRAGSLPDVKLYDAIFGVASNEVPGGYGAFRVEFDVSLMGASVATADPLFDPAVGASSACAPSSTPTVSFIDVTGGGSVIPNAAIPASVCYDPSNPTSWGSRLVITPGASADPARVFSCGTFAAAGALEPVHSYALHFAQNSIFGYNGKPVIFPSGGEWKSGTFSTRTADLSVLAAGRREATGHLVFLAKPARGFMSPLQPEVLPEGASYRHPARQDPLLVYFSDSLTLPAQAAIVTRTADGSVFPVRVDNCGYDAVRGCDGDPRVLVVTPVGTWEPGVEYSVTLDPAVASARSGTRLGAVRPLVFKVADAPPAVVLSRPGKNASSVQFNAPISLTLQSPVDPASVGPDSVTLSQNGVPVEADLVLPDATSNFQTITVVPRQPLLPRTRYSLAARDLTTHPTIVPALAGKAFQPFEASFTTAAFRLARLSDAAAPDQAIDDRASSLSPLFVANGRLTVVFNEAAGSVDKSSLRLEEVLADGTAVDVGADVQAVNATTFVLRAPADRPLKPGTAYRVTADPAITDGRGFHVAREECAAACRDQRTFRVAGLSAALALIDPKTATFEVRTSLPVEAGSLAALLPASAADLARPLRLFHDRPDGSLVQVPLSCSIPAGDTATAATCRPAAALVAGARYRVIGNIPPASPLLVAPRLSDATGTYRVDQQVGRLVTQLNLSFDGCAP